MDSHELFWQLTRGVHFAKKQTLLKKDSKNDTGNEANRGLKRSSELISNTEAPGTNLGKTENETFMDTLEANQVKYFKCDDLTPILKKKKTKTSQAVGQKLEMINKLRKEYNITVFGKNIPDPIQTFENLRDDYKVKDRLIKNLEICNYSTPTPIQMQAIPIMLNGRNLVACAPTGSGKTIAFLTPILNSLQEPSKMGPRALILAPTKELAQQIYRECVRLCEKTALKIHIISNGHQAERQLGCNRKSKSDILIGTPYRLKYILEEQPQMLDLKRVEWLVLDEADRLMDETQDNFREQLDGILTACRNTHTKIALFSATNTVPLSKWIVKHLKNVIRVTIGQQNAANESVEQELLFVGSENGKLLAIRNMVQEGLKPPVLIFVQTKDRAKQLFSELLYDGINVDVIHADRSQQQRANSVRAFREGHIWVLICTELMSRGIDFKGVNLVVNYDFPPSTISYIHRIGRTGRAGRSGKAITFFTQDDTPNLRKIAQVIKDSGGKVPEFLLNMKKPRKSEIRKYQNYAPPREPISTRIQPETPKNKK